MENKVAVEQGASSDSEAPLLKGVKGMENKDLLKTEERNHRRRHSRSGSRDQNRSLHALHDRRRRKGERRRRRRSSSRSSGSYSRCRSRSSSESESSSGGRSRHRRKRRSRRRRSSSRAPSGDKRKQYESASQYDSYSYQEPNNTVMVRGLALHLDENDIRNEVFKCGIVVKDVRLIRNHETGESRRFAFVEFNSVADASKWMEMKKGVVLLRDEFKANLIYSVPKASRVDGTLKHLDDWQCEVCDAMNFKRREICYKCNASKPKDRAYEEPGNEASCFPTSVIILENLDALTTEEGVLLAFQSNPQLASIPIKSVKIVRDSVTGISTGKCCVESNNLCEAAQLFTTLTSETLEIDGRNVSIKYGKRPSEQCVKKNAAAESALAAAHWTNSTLEYSHSTLTDPPYAQVKSEDDAERMSRYCSKYFAKTFEEYEAYLDYYRKFYHQQLKESFTSGLVSDSSSSRCQSQNENSEHQQNAANSNTPVVAASVQFSRRKSPQHGPQAQFHWSNEDKFRENPVSDGSYKYENSEYYYDSESGLFCDAEKQYFYDAERDVFLQWNALSQAYVEVSVSCNSGESQSSKFYRTSDEKREKTLVAKDIVKNMEKWAKTLNPKKERKTAVGVESNVSKCFRIKDCSPESVSRTHLGSTKPSCNKNNTPFSRNPEKTPSVQSDDKEKCRSQEKVETNSNIENFVDENILACLLCKRKFKSKEVLEKHVKESDLHKKNMESIGQIPKGQPPVSSFDVLYRDRAKERRATYNYSNANYY